MSCQLEPTIWSCDTGQQIPCFDRCQLIITWMSNTKEVHSKQRLHVSLSTCYLEYGRHVAQLHRCHCAYVPTSNTASHDNHEKINSWVSFCFPYMGCLWGSTWRPFGPPELHYYWQQSKRILSIRLVKSLLRYTITLCLTHQFCKVFDSFCHCFINISIYFITTWKDGAFRLESFFKCLFIS